MHFFTVFSAFLASATAVVAQGPAVSYVTYCQHVNFNGNCFQVQVLSGVCTGIDSQFADIISSFFGTGGGGCTLWTEADCHGESLTLPANEAVSNVGTVFNDQTASFICEQ